MSLADRLRVELACDLPGPKAQAEMAPGHRTISERSIENRRCREAAVLILVVEPTADARPSGDEVISRDGRATRTDDGSNQTGEPDRPHASRGQVARTGRVLLTVRPDTLSTHAGQVSFPGGSLEDGESHEDAAIRETQEETGLVVDPRNVLGSLTPLFVPPTRFCVHPVVASYRGDTTELPFTLSEDEVSSVLMPDIAYLARPMSRGRESRLLHGRAVNVPYFSVDGFKVWGATAMILSEFVAIARRVVGRVP